MSVFSFVDEVIELKKNQSVTAFFTLKGDEEFLLDHFSGFPVMPGVLLLESLKQASSRVLESDHARLVSAEDVKFGQFVRPGGVLKIQAPSSRSSSSLASTDKSQGGAGSAKKNAREILARITSFLKSIPKPNNTPPACAIISIKNAEGTFGFDGKCSMKKSSCPEKNFRALEWLPFFKISNLSTKSQRTGR